MKLKNSLCREKSLNSSSKLVTKNKYKKIEEMHKQNLTDYILKILDLQNRSTTYKPRYRIIKKSITNYSLINLILRVN